MSERRPAERWGRLIEEHFETARARDAGAAIPPLPRSARRIVVGLGAAAGCCALLLLGVCAWYLHEAYVGHPLGRGVPAERAIHPGALGLALSVAGGTCLLIGGYGASRRGRLGLQAVVALLSMAVYATYFYAQWVADRIGCLSTCG